MGFERKLVLKSGNDKKTNYVDFFWVLGGRITWAVSQWTILIVLTKFGDVSDVGELSIGLAVCGPIIGFCNMHLRNLYATDAEGKFGHTTYLKLRIWLALAALCGCTMAGFVFFGYKVGLMTCAVAIPKCLDLIGDHYYGVVQKYQKLDRMGKSLVLRGIFSTFLFMSTYWLTGNAVYSVLTLTLVSFLILFAFDKKASRLVDSAGIKEGESCFELFRVAFPMGICFLLGSLQANVPRYAVEYYSGTEMLGVFVPMSYILTIGNMVTFAFGAPLSPKMAISIKQKDNLQFKKLLGIFILTSVLLGVFTVGFAVTMGTTFLELAYTEAYSEYNDVFVWICISGVFQFLTTPFMHALTVLRCLKAYALIQAVSVVVITVACNQLVPVFGLVGAAQSSMLGFICIVAVSLNLVYQALKCNDKHYQ